MLQEIINLIKKDIRLEIRQKYAINGILLYILSSVFITYLSFGSIISQKTWIALFWIIIVFITTNALSKSFVQESRARQLYYYSIASPQGIILAKILYNFILTILLSVIFFLVFVLLFDSFIEHRFLFFLTLILGNSGFGAVLTMVSAMASKTNNNFTLMTILGFPLVLPILIICIRLTKFSIMSIVPQGSIMLVIALGMLILIILILSFLLFPFLWND